LIQADFARLPLDRLANLDGNNRPLLDCSFKCSGCGSRSVALFLFSRCAERHLILMPLNVWARALVWWGE
jgi:hypothetical protein